MKRKVVGKDLLGYFGLGFIFSLFLGAIITIMALIYEPILTVFGMHWVVFWLILGIVLFVECTVTGMLMIYFVKNDKFARRKLKR